MEKKERKGLRGAPLCILIAVGVALLFLLLLIVYFSEIKPKDPSLTVDGILLLQRNTDANPNPNPNPNPSPSTWNAITRSQMLLGSTVCINASLHNPNRAAFVYENVGASMSYKGKEAGFLLIPGGAVRARATTRFGVCLSAGAGAGAGDGNGDAGMGSNMATLTTQISVEGDVSVLGGFSHHASSSCNCIVSISTASQNVVAYNCGSK